MCTAVLGLLFPAVSNSDLIEEVWGYTSSESFRISFFQLYFPPLVSVSDLLNVFQWTTVSRIFIVTSEHVF